MATYALKLEQNLEYKELQEANFQLYHLQFKLPNYYNALALARALIIEEKSRIGQYDLIDIINEIPFIVMAHQRKQLKMTKKETANLCDISASYYSRIENGKVKPSEQIKQKIANVLEVDIDKLC